MKKYLFILSITMFTSWTLKGQDKNYEEWYLSTADTLNVFVKEIKSTSKDTVIVVHGGFGANHDYMLDAIEGLENRFHFFLYDQRGSLLSPAPTEKLTVQKNVNDLYELVVELKLKKVKLLCHSMGTFVCMEFAKKYPELVSNLVLSGAIIPVAKSSNDVFSEQMNKNVEFLANRPEVKRAKEYYEKKSETLTDKERTEFWRLNFAAANIYNISKVNLVKGGWIYYNQQASIMSETVNWDYDYRSVINSLKTTIIQGQYDFLDFNLTNYKERTKDFKNIETIIIPNAGHNSWVDKPILFREYLVRALRK